MGQNHSTKPELGSEAELGRRLRERDQHVLADLYDRYVKVVYTVIYQYVRNPATAEDLTQETFL